MAAQIRESPETGELANVSQKMEIFRDLVQYDQNIAQGGGGDLSAMPAGRSSRGSGHLALPRR